MMKDISPTHWRAKGPSPAIAMAPVSPALAKGPSATAAMIQVIAKGIQAETSMLIMVEWNWLKLLVVSLRTMYKMMGTTQRSSAMIP